MPARSAQPRTRRAAVATSLAIDAATAEAVAALEKTGIRVLLLKGPALAHLLYDAGEERAWDDADLLVGPGDEPAALARLAELGFRPRISDPLERGSVPYAVHLVRPVRVPLPGGPSSESIDLHHGFAGVGAPASEFWDSLVSQPDAIELFGRRVEVPSVAARLALVALHGAAHGREMTRPHRDLVRAVERFGGPEWSAALGLARRWQALDLFVAGIASVPGGDRLLSGLGVGHRPSTGALMRAEGMPRAQRSFEQLGRAGSLGERLRIVARKLVPSPQVMRTWQPLARRGVAGLALAYAWRPLWLLAQLPPALRSYLRARAARR